MVEESFTSTEHKLKKPVVDEDVFRPDDDDDDDEEEAEDDASTDTLVAVVIVEFLIIKSAGGDALPEATNDDGECTLDEGNEDDGESTELVKQVGFRTDDDDEIDEAPNKGETIFEPVEAKELAEFGVVGADKICKEDDEWDEDDLWADEGETSDDDGECCSDKLSNKSNFLDVVEEDNDDDDDSEELWDTGPGEGIIFGKIRWLACWVDDEAECKSVGCGSEGKWVELRRCGATGVCGASNDDDEDDVDENDVTESEEDEPSKCKDDDDNEAKRDDDAAEVDDERWLTFTNADSDDEWFESRFPFELSSSTWFSSPSSSLSLSTR